MLICDGLPDLLRAEGLPLVWFCDPSDGNGSSVKKYGAVTNDEGQWEFWGMYSGGGSGADSESTGGN